MSNFVEVFNSELSKRNINFQLFSLITGISTSQLSKYASGSYEPSLKKAILISNAFSCSIDYLVGLDENPNRYELTEENINVFYSRFNSLLKVNNQNVNKLSKTINVNRNCIYYWKNNSVFPKLGILRKISIELHTNIEYLIGRTDYSEHNYGI